MPSGARTMDEETAPKVIVKKIEGKMETLERHVPQMLLRGEQVAIIVKINWDGEYVLPPRNGHCDVTSRDIMLRRIESSRATLYLHQLYLFFFLFLLPRFVSFSFEQYYRINVFDVFHFDLLHDPGEQCDSSKKRKNGAKIWNNSQRIINYNRTFRVESKQKSNNVSRVWYFFYQRLK